MRFKKGIGSVGLIHGRLEPKQWTDVSTPRVLLDALSYGYVHLGREIGLLGFDESHHAKGNHPMNCIVRNFYFKLPARPSMRACSHVLARGERPMIYGLTASPMFGGNAAKALR